MNTSTCQTIKFNVIEPTPNLIGDLVEKLLPYFGTGVVGAIILAVFNKIANRKKEYAEIDKTEAETEQILSNTYGSLNKTLVETNEKLSKALGDTNDKLRAQTDLNLTLERLQLDKDIKYAADLGTVLAEKMAILARFEESDILAHRTTQTTRRLMDKLNTPYWETDEKGRSLFVNAAWLNMFGVTEETLDKWIETVIEKDRQRILDQWRQQLSDTDTVTAIIFKIREGEQIFAVQSIYAVVRGKGGDIVKIIGVTIRR